MSIPMCLAEVRCFREPSTLGSGLLQKLDSDSATKRGRATGRIEALESIKISPDYLPHED